MEDICWAANQQGKYLPLLSIIIIIIIIIVPHKLKKKMPKTMLLCQLTEKWLIFRVSHATWHSEVNINDIIVYNHLSELANQHAPKKLFTCVV